MTVIYLLICISLILATGFLIAFIWAVRNGQYDDDQSPAHRIFFDSRPKRHSSPSNPTPKKRPWN